MGDTISALKASGFVTTDASAKMVTVAEGGPGSPDIRRFDIAALNKEIDDYMSTLSESEHVAAFAYVDKDGPGLAIVGKVPKKIVPIGHAEWTVTSSVSMDMKDFKWKVGLRWKF